MSALNLPGDEWRGSNVVITDELTSFFRFHFFAARIAHGILPSFQVCFRGMPLYRLSLGNVESLQIALGQIVVAGDIIDAFE
jgi:hypothetical protein